MPRKKKLKKYNEIKNFSNVIESRLLQANPMILSRKWENSLFAMEQDITLELGCGMGEYTLNLARRYPERNFIGADIKGARIWHGASSAQDCGLSNILFVRIQADHLALFFPENTVSEIWIPFPEPHNRQPGKNSKNRLTSERFLNIYSSILKSGGVIHLKTDDEALYEFTLEQVEARGGRIVEFFPDLYCSGVKNDATEIQTGYEKRYLSESKAIKYAAFTL